MGVGWKFLVDTDEASAKEKQASTMSKSADEVEKQLNNMISFIHAEAREKVQEINVRAEEDFNIEKTSIIQEEKKRINEDFEQKCKQIDVQKKITYSNQLNACRLATLKAREAAIQEIFQVAQSKLVGLTADKAAYKNLIQQLILQALMKLREAEVSVICRREDDDIVKEALPGAIEAYKQKSGIDAKVTVEAKHKLAPAPSGKPGAFCSGGIVLAAKEGRILCNNTLDQRISLASEGLLPEIRAALFSGPSQGISLEKH